MLCFAVASYFPPRDNLCNFVWRHDGAALFSSTNYKIISEESNLHSKQRHPDTQTAQISGTVQIKPNDERQTTQTSLTKKRSAKVGRKFIIIGSSSSSSSARALYWRSTFTEDTDDAQVDGDLYQVSSRVTGQVIKVSRRRQPEVNVRRAHRRDRPQDYQVALEQAPGQPRQRARQPPSRHRPTCPSPT